METINWTLLISGACKGAAHLLSRGLHASSEASWVKPYLQVHWGLRLQNTISRAGNLVPSKWRALCATKVFCLFVSLCLKNVLKAFLCRSDLLKF